MEVDSGEKLSGFELDEDIQIKIIGNRGGEKLKEELWSERETVSKTHNPYILRIVENSNLLSGEDFFKKLKELESVASKFNEGKIKLLLKDIIPEYKTIN
jgi:FlaA1/EpsC-like NDP-sugar epimerase